MTEGGGALGAIEASGLGQAMRQWMWLYPAVETVHIVGIGLLFGSIAVLDLRLIGFSRGISVKTLASHVLPWTAASFLLIIPSGLMMFTAHAGDFISSPVFLTKMCLILAGGLNAALFHAGGRLRHGGDALAKAQGLLSLGIWIAVIICGRWIAYV